MSFIHVTSATAGAPVLNPVNGALCSVLDWALPQAGWEILYSSGFARVYRSQNGRCLHVNHNSAVSGDARRATVRGAASASSATALVNPYPTQEQCGNDMSSWRIDTTTSTGGRTYDIVADSNFLILAIQQGSRQAEVYFFGEVITDLPDAGACVIHVSSTSSVTNTAQQGIRGAFSSATFVAASQSSINIYWQGNVDGSKNSTVGFLFGPGFGMSGAVQARGGYEQRVFREPVVVADYGQEGPTTIPPLGIPKRGILPNLWSALHGSNGSMAPADTFGDSAYDPAARFKFADQVIWEITDTFRPR